MDDPLQWDLLRHALGKLLKYEYVLGKKVSVINHLLMNKILIESKLNI